MQSFLNADTTLLPQVNQPEKVKNGEVLDVPAIVQELNKLGGNAHYLPEISNIIEFLQSQDAKPCVALIMSNGSFSGLHEKLITNVLNN